MTRGLVLAFPSPSGLTSDDLERVYRFVADIPGAQVDVFWNGQHQIQEVSGGSGFCSQNQRSLHFGLGSATAVDKVVVRWPSGKMSELSAPAVNQLHAVKEPV